MTTTTLDVALRSCDACEVSNFSINPNDCEERPGYVAIMLPSTGRVSVFALAQQIVLEDGGWAWARDTDGDDHYWRFIKHRPMTQEDLY
jgi:hypothetical protein